MKIIIEGTAKEIADLVREIQDRQISVDAVATAMEKRINQRKSQGENPFSQI